MNNSGNASILNVVPPMTSMNGVSPMTSMNVVPPMNTQIPYGVSTITTTGDLLDATGNPIVKGKTYSCKGGLRGSKTIMLDYIDTKRKTVGGISADRGKHRGYKSSSCIPVDDISIKRKPGKAVSRPIKTVKTPRSFGQTLGLDATNTAFNPLMQGLKEVDALLGPSNTFMIGGEALENAVGSDTPIIGMGSFLKPKQSTALTLSRKSCSCTNVQRNVFDALNILRSIKNKVLTLKASAPLNSLPIPSATNQPLLDSPLLGGGRRRLSKRRTHRSRRS